VIEMDCNPRQPRYPEYTTPNPEDAENATRMSKAGRNSRPMSCSALMATRPLRRGRQYGEENLRRKDRPMRPPRPVEKTTQNATFVVDVKSTSPLTRRIRSSKENGARRSIYSRTGHSLHQAAATNELAPLAGFREVRSLLSSRPPIGLGLMKLRPDAAIGDPRKCSIATPEKPMADSATELGVALYNR